MMNEEKNGETNEKFLGVVQTKVISSEDAAVVEKETNDFLQSLFKQHMPLLQTTHFGNGDAIACCIVYQVPVKIIDKPKEPVNVKEL